jgi:xanthine dehydrogenase YagR molybdenum-binding subunit
MGMSATASTEPWVVVPAAADSPVRPRTNGGTEPGVTGPLLRRLDGPLKAAGAARYAADEPVDGAVHAVLVPSAIARGRIVRIDPAAAEAAPGVLLVLTHENAPTLRRMRTFSRGGTAIQAKPPLVDDRIDYAGQHVALVVAATPEQARYAASLLAVDYAAEAPRATLDGDPAGVSTPRSIMGEAPDHARGDPERGIAASTVRIGATYSTPIEHHNPIEPLTTTAVWGEDGGLTVYESTQGVATTRMGVAQALGLPGRKVRVVSRFVGGGFGCKGWYCGHITLAAVAARQLGRPVRLALSRAQMYTTVGYRPATIQHLALGAARDGRLTAILHDSTASGSAMGEFPEPSTQVSKHLYAVPNLRTRERVGVLDLAVPSSMRAPGEAPGSFALESALDELAVELGMDPIALRLRNDAAVDPDTGRPWNGRRLRECFAEGAARFGWDGRTREPRSMRDGHELIGWGVATAFFPSAVFPATARARIFADGRAEVESATADLGTGTLTIMTRIAADALGLPPACVTFTLGDSRLPFAFPAGGSSTARSVGPAVQAAALAARRKVTALAVRDPASPLHGASPEAVDAAAGELFLRDDSARRDTLAAVLTRAGKDKVEAGGRYGVADAAAMMVPMMLGPRFGGVARRLISPFAGKRAPGEVGAQFVEVRVDPDFGTVRVSRALGVFDIGTVLNPATARSQAIGGIGWGIGMALLERTEVHPTLAKIVSPNLSGYLVPSHADVPDIDAAFLDQADPAANPLGARGVGEIGVVGVAAAVANAVYHATGVRVRDLPITPEKLLPELRS